MSEVDLQIDALQRIAAERDDVLALGGGLPASELFPRAELESAFAESLAVRGDPALQYGWPEGTPGLRAWIAARLRARGAVVDDADVLITSGAQQAIAIAAEILLHDGDSVAVDAETYPAALDVFRGRGAVAKEMPWGADVVRYVMPGVSNPRGVDLSPEARRALLASSAPFIADEAYTDLCFGDVSRPLLADARDRAWHVGTFSKTLAPGLRIGYLVTPPAAHARALELKHATDLQAPSVGQALLEAFLAKDDFDARLTRARAFYRDRATRFAEALRRSLPSARFVEPTGGFSIFVETDARGDDTAFLRLATAEGVSFDPGSMFRPASVDRPLSLRLCYSATSPDAYDEAMRRLARALAKWS